jgi:hypothetical protein
MYTDLHVLLVDVMPEVGEVPVTVWTPGSLASASSWLAGIATS